VFLRTAHAVEGLPGLVRYRRNASGRTQRELTTAAAWFAVLTSDFGLSLPELSRQERHALWSTVRRAHDQWLAGALTPGEQ